ncbi:MAG: hypothetical protein LBK62_10010 [Treponema sp.]|jgi:hypothetical protein|nr:hypothetical protein [Treponema sp.]
MFVKNFQWDISNYSEMLERIASAGAIFFRGKKGKHAILADREREQKRGTKTVQTGGDEVE